MDEDWVQALVNALICYGPVVAVGWIARLLLDRRFRGTGLVDAPRLNDPHPGGRPMIPWRHWLRGTGASGSRPAEPWVRR